MKVATDAQLPVALPDGLVLDEMTPEEAEQFVEELLEENQEVLRGLSKR